MSATGAPAAVEHRVKIVDAAPDWPAMVTFKARCECGWESDFAMMPVLLEEEVRAHFGEVAPGRNVIKRAVGRFRR